MSGSKPEREEGTDCVYVYTTEYFFHFIILNFF